MKCWLRKKRFSAVRNTDQLNLLNNSGCTRKMFEQITSKHYSRNSPNLRFRERKMLNTINGEISAGFRWWGAWGPGVVGGPMCGYKMSR